MLCQECSKKESCVELCLKAEKWVNSDHVSQRELPCNEFTLEYLNYISPVKWQTIASYHHVESLEFPFLSDLQNKCLHLFYFQGLTYKQIAFRLSGRYRKLSLKAVKGQLARAKKKIRSICSISRGEYITHENI